jgi:RluA family pseudouridine synthase
MKARENLEILHEDGRLILVNKPARMLTVAADPGAGRGKGAPLCDRLQALRGDVFPVHRLDFETSGVVLFAKDEQTRDELVALFRDGQVEKVYLALVQGWPSPPGGVLDFPIRDLGASAVIAKGGAPARTRYTTVRRVGPCALMKVKLETGRHNQIRLHFSHVGYPLVGERKYSIGRLARVRHGRVLLHASSLAFTPSHLRHVLRITAPLPADFSRVLETLEASAATRDSGPR